MPEYILNEQDKRIIENAKRFYKNYDFDLVKKYFQNMYEKDFENEISSIFTFSVVSYISVQQHFTPDWHFSYPAKPSP